MNVGTWFVRIAGCVLLLHAAVWVNPTLVQDDFDILPHALTWRATQEATWIPQNEHTMPLGRLSTWGLVQLSPSKHGLAYLAAMQGVVGILLAIPLVYLFVARETQSPPLGVLASLLFAVSSIYQQAVVWFAASFSILALDTLLLALLAAQAWRMTGKAIYLDLCVLCCLLAPGWFASGILAGPFCVLYLIWPEAEAASRWNRLSLLPLLGSALFLAIALPRVAATILHLPHYQGQTALEAFAPGTGILYTCRSLVDNLLLGQIGLTGISPPPGLAFVVLAILLVILGRWILPAGNLRLAVLGGGLILAPYLLTYSARAAWDYSESGFYTHVWNRYHLFPQLGVSLLVIAGLSGRLSETARADFSTTWQRRLSWLLVILLVLHLPRGILATPKVWEQWDAFSRLDRVDSRCREMGIDRKEAIAVLPPWTGFPGAAEKFNAWTLLQGSPNPRPVEPEEIRRLLE